MTHDKQSWDLYKDVMNRMHLPRAERRRQLRKLEKDYEKDQKQKGKSK
jgi:hypothetical protein